MAAPAIGALLATLAGLVTLGRGVFYAAPIVFFYTEEEYAIAYEARTEMLIATAVLLLASGVFGWQGRWWSALLVATPGVVCTTLAIVLGPALLFALYLFLPLAPIAAVTALVATIRGPASR